MTAIFSGGQLTGIEQQPSGYGGGLGQYPTTIIPRLDKDGRIVDIDRVAASVGDPEWMYRTQPAIRQVVDWRVNRIIRAPLQALVRDAPDRIRPAAGFLARAIKDPEAPERAGQAAWLADLAYDWHLHDRWLVLVARSSDGAGYNLIRLPAWRWKPQLTSLGRVTSILVDGRTELDPKTVVYDYGRGGGTSPMATLQEVISEIVEGSRYRRQQWARGVRAKAVVERDREAGDWSDGALKRFRESFGDSFTGDGPEAGGVPVLEDGMKLRTIDLMTATDTEYLEGLRLNTTFVAMAYDTAPELLGLRPGTYSNMDALRQSIYRETLGGFFTRFADALSGLAELFPGVEPNTYIAHDLERALAGSFLELHQVLQTATGAPYMARNEARERIQLEPKDGLDEIVVPLNVLIGGLASPRDTAPPPALPKEQHDHAAGDKARSTAWRDVVRERLERELAAFFADQQEQVTKALTEQAKTIAPGPLEWDQETWNAALAAILLRHAKTSADQAAREVLDRFGADPDSFDYDKMLSYLIAAANNTADRMNTATHAKVAEAVVSGDDWQDQLDGVYQEAKGDRAITLAASMVAGMAGFGGHEAARTVGARTKTWRTLSANPRASHKAIDGETVDLDATFGNGLRYPGDHAGSADESAGCTCALEFGQ